MRRLPDRTSPMATKEGAADAGTEGVLCHASVRSRQDPVLGPDEPLHATRTGLVMRGKRASGLAVGQPPHRDPFGRALRTRLLIRRSCRRGLHLEGCNASIPPADTSVTVGGHPVAIATRGSILDGRA